jgi:hypothetical protein
VEWLAGRAGFLGAVQHGDAGGGHGQRGHELGGRERPVQPDLQHTDPLAALDQMGDRLARGLGGGTHQDQDPLGVRGAVILHDAVVASGAAGEPVHGVLDDGGHSGVERVDRLTALEVDVRILGGAPDHRAFRGQRS